MDNSIKIEEVLAQDIENLKNMEPGSVEKEKEVRNIDILYRLNLEDAKLGQQAYMDDKRLEQEEKKTKVQTGVELIKTGAPLLAYGIFYGMGLKFEETGAFTSQTVKGLLNKVKFFK